MKGDAYAFRSRCGQKIPGLDTPRSSTTTDRRRVARPRRIGGLPVTIASAPQIFENGESPPLAYKGVPIKPSVCPFESTIKPDNLPKLLIPLMVVLPTPLGSSTE